MHRALHLTALDLPDSRAAEQSLRQYTSAFSVPAEGIPGVIGPRRRKRIAASLRFIEAELLRLGERVAELQLTCSTRLSDTAEDLLNHAWAAWTQKEEFSGFREAYDTAGRVHDDIEDFVAAVRSDFGLAPLTPWTPKIMLRKGAGSRVDST